MSESIDDAVAGVLAGHTDDVVKLTRSTVDLLAGLVPDPTITAENGDIGIGDGPGYRGLIFVVTPQAAGVRVGVAGGAELDDAHGVLTGRGKVHRHVKLASLDDLTRPELLHVLDAAARRRPGRAG